MFFVLQCLLFQSFQRSVCGYNILPVSCEMQLSFRARVMWLWQCACVVCPRESECLSRPNFWSFPQIANLRGFSVLARDLIRWPSGLMRIVLSYLMQIG